MRLLLLCLSAVAAVVSAQDGYEQGDQVVVRGARYTVQAGPQNHIQQNVQQYLRASQADDDDDDTTPQASLAYRRPYEQDPPRKSQSKNTYETKESKKTLLEEEEIEEPDRLSVLLPDSTFSCQDRATGYYADEGLSCEVFHYCQEGAKHSWVCPEGFSFHQVHLICMPPSTENICDQSSQYHFVNDFLYKPVNEEEVNATPNVSLKYSDRYYPENVHQSPDRASERQHHRQPLQVGLPSRKSHVQQQQQQSTVSASAYRHAPSQVFRSPEEVNIPLQQRRPVQQHTYDVQDFQYEE